VRDIAEPIPEHISLCSMGRWVSKHATTINQTMNQYAFCAQLVLVFAWEGPLACTFCVDRERTLVHEYPRVRCDLCGTFFLNRWSCGHSGVANIIVPSISINYPDCAPAAIGGETTRQWVVRFVHEVISAQVFSEHVEPLLLDALMMKRKEVLSYIDRRLGSQSDMKDKRKTEKRFRCIPRPTQLAVESTCEKDEA